MLRRRWLSTHTLPHSLSTPQTHIELTQPSSDDEDDEEVVFVLETSFMSYLRSQLFARRSPRSFFFEWPLDAMLREDPPPSWRLQTDSKWFYIIYNTVHRLTTHVGCTHDLAHRFALHRGWLKGCPSSTRQAKGTWRLVLCIRLPPLRNWHVDVLKRETHGKGIAVRTLRVLQFAQRANLDWRLAVEVLEPSSKDFYMPELVTHLATSTATSTPPLLTSASALQPHLMHSLVVPTASTCDVALERIQPLVAAAAVAMRAQPKRRRVDAPNDQ